MKKDPLSLTPMGQKGAKRGPKGGQPLSYKL